MLSKLNPNIDLVQNHAIFTKNRDVTRVNQACHSKQTNFNVPMNSWSGQILAGCRLVCLLVPPDLNETTI